MKAFLIAVIFSWPILVCAQNLGYVKHIVDTLASPYMAGRGYVDNGLDKAAHYIVHQFDSLGIDSLPAGRYQSFVHSVNTFPEQPVLVIDGHSATPGVDFLVNAHSPNWSGEHAAMQVDTTYIDRPEDVILTGGAVYVVHPVSPANRDGASARAELIRYISQYAPVIDPVQKLTWSVGASTAEHPVIEVDQSLVNWRDASSISLEIESELIPEFESKNIFGLIPATAPTDEYLVFTAHYDHLGKMGEAIFRGANDNASGVATLLDLGRHFAENPINKNILLIAFAGEEAGLVGSKYFVDHPLIPLESIDFLINLDLIGNGEEGITVVNGKLFEDEFHQLAQINTEHNLLEKIRIRGAAANSDHYWFTKHGVPAFFIYTLGPRKAYHDVHDVPETLEFLGYEGLFNLILHFVDTR